MTREPYPSNPPVSRNTDPATSHQAERELSPKRRAAVKRKLLAYIIEHPGLVRGEIAEGTGLPQPSAWRRISDLKNDKLIRSHGTAIYKGTNRRQACWFAVPIAPSQPGLPL